MKIYRLTSVSEGVVNAFANLIPQLAPDCVLPTKKDLEAIVKSNHTLLFMAEEDKLTNFESIQVDSYASPYQVDLNDDNVKDLLVGTGDGKLAYFKNDGTDKIPFFCKSQDIRIASKQHSSNFWKSTFVGCCR